MKLGLKKIITIRMIFNKLCQNCLDEAKTEIPSLIHPFHSESNVEMWHWDETLLMAGILMAILTLFSKRLEIKGEDKLKPFIDATHIHQQIKLTLFIIVLFTKYYYYTPLHSEGFAILSCFM